MAEESYKINQVIKVDYQAIGSQSGLTVQMDVYDEADVLDVAQSDTMIELGTRGKYTKNFTPDAAGDWRVEIDDGVGGKVIKSYSVGTDNVSSIGGKIDALNDIDAAGVNAEVDTALADYDAPTKVELDSAQSAIQGADDDTLKDISDQIDGITGAAGSPPMIG